MVGIGGIGMSALAQLYASKGIHVSGSDRGESPVIDLLRSRGSEVFKGHDATHMPTETSLVVYSDAVPADNPERVVARERGIRELSYFSALGEATQEGTSIVVSGTHGKTTTTAMLAKILIDTGRNPTVVAGSILSEHGSNFIAGRPDLFVIEGCEYRRHFLELHPTVLVITNIELDHTDYFKDLTDIQNAFREVIARVPQQGAIVTNTDSTTIRSVIADVSVKKVPYQEVQAPTLLAPGVFNTQNAQAAKAAAYAVDPDLHEADVDRALAGFTGTWRRFEYKGVTKEGAVVYDDYAHHPTAVGETLRMIRKEFPDKRILIIFHPHLYSRTRDFMNEFAEALAEADEVVLAPIYAAREAPIEGITSNVLAEKITALGTPAHAFTSLKEIEEHLLSPTSNLKPQTLLLTMGAGDVYMVADALVVKK
jgi:UDP-N-acetylmuramate--alanine ligase